MISIQKRPEIRQIQPIGFGERLEASSAPTMGNARKDTKISESPTPLSASQLPGEYADWARKDSTRVATAIIKQSPASDHASQEAMRMLNAPPPVPVSRPAATTARRGQAASSPLPPQPGRRSAPPGPSRL